MHKQILGMHVHGGKAMWGHSKKAAICKPRIEASEETKPADILISAWKFSSCLYHNLEEKGSTAQWEMKWRSQKWS